MFNIFSVIVMVTLVVGIIVFCYYLIYVNNINKKIQNGKVSNKKMTDIPKVIMITIIVLILFYSIILSVGLRQADKNGAIVNHNNFVAIDLSDYTFNSYSGLRETDDASFARVYSKEVNAGYDKSIVRDSDFVFTIFIRNTDQDDFHPDYLCYVDYVGEVKTELVKHTNFEYIDVVSGKVAGGISSGGGDVQISLLYIGNLNAGESFRITEGVLDAAAEQELGKADEEAYKADKGEFPSFTEYALTSGSAIITIE